MKRFKFVSIIFLLLLTFFSQSYGQNKIDFWLKELITTEENEPFKLSKELHDGLQFVSADKIPMVNAIIQTSDGNFDFIAANKGRLRTVAGSYATALLPLSVVKDISKFPHVKYISGATKTKTLNDRAMALMGVKDAITMGYTGKNVLVGVVDTGIDINHPGFKDASGKTRILYLWDQVATGSGLIAPYYDYGIEWTKNQIDAGYCTSADSNGHGTHVAGSMAQYIPAGSDSAYGGGAIHANLVIVKTNMLSSGILDGINYIFEKARQLGKPVIVNISLGTQQGPHDGTDLLTAATDYLTGPGRIITQSAGNDAENFIHHRVEADGDGKNMKFSIDIMADKLEFDLWYDGTKNVTIQIYGPGNTLLLTAPSGSKTDGFITTSSGKIKIDNASEGPEFYNDDKEIIIELKSALPGEWQFKLSCSTPTTVHAWMFSGDPEAKFRFDTNDNHYTLVNEACGKKVIAVGAMVTRDTLITRDVKGYPDGTIFYSGEKVGMLASYSSGGPTRDGRHKPEVIAPGSYIISSMSKDIPQNPQFSSSDFRSIGPRYPVFGTKYQQYMQGTSMSAPVFASAISSLLEKDQELDPTGVQEFVENNCIHLSPGLTGWDYREGNGVIDLKNSLDGQTAVVSCSQFKEQGNKLTLRINPVVEGAGDIKHYSIVGASSSISIINAAISGNEVTLTLSDQLKEGYRDHLKITGLKGLAEPTTIEIDKVGTVVDIPALMTNEIWHAEDSPYYIHGEVLIPSSVQLKIEPGTVVKFMPNELDSSGLIVDGKLLAQGTRNETIVFTAFTESNNMISSSNRSIHDRLLMKDKLVLKGITDKFQQSFSLNKNRNGKWLGIAFLDSIPKTVLKFCEIRYAEYGIICYSDSLSIENCKISHSGEAGFWAQDCHPNIKYCYFEFNYGGVVALQSNVIIEYCNIFHSIDPGIWIQDCSPAIRRTIVWDSKGGDMSDGIYLINAPSATIIENVTSYGNDRVGIACFSSNPKILNSIVCKNAYGTHSQDGTPPEITYTDVWGNGSNYSGISPGTGCISLNPIFIYPDSGNFQLATNSPCIDKGNPDSKYNDPDGTRNDMGALPFILPPYPPLLLKPTDGDTGISLNPSLVWKIVNDADSYIIQLSSNSGFLPTLIDTSDVTLDSIKISGLTFGTKYYWRVKAENRGGASDWSQIFNFTTKTQPSIVDQLDIDLPDRFSIEQNYPNPFNPVTTISFQIPKANHIVITIFNILGVEIYSLNKNLNPGYYHIHWNGKDQYGNSLPSGVYFYQLHTESFIQTKKMILLR